MSSYVVQLPHCTSQALIKPYAFEMYVRVRVLDEQEEKGLFVRHLTDQCCMQNHSADAQHGWFNRVTVFPCKPTLTTRMRIDNAAGIEMECHSDPANSQST
jgi:hypothetical protein